MSALQRLILGRRPDKTVEAGQIGSVSRVAWGRASNTNPLPIPCKMNHAQSTEVLFALVSRIGLEGP
jgi:hypothetical protein